MRELVILSGKGGTGKTSFTAALAALARPLVVADCDVDAPNLPLLLSRGEELAAPRSFLGRFEMRVDEQRCLGCGLCEMACRFQAVRVDVGESLMLLPVFDPFACEGCGLCARICPNQAIAMERRVAGEVRVGAASVGPLVHASLAIGEENSGNLVSLVRQTAQEVAVDRDLDLILCDGPPGVGCPVIAAASHASFALLVTEPSPAALHDMQRTAELAEQFAIPAAVVLNKSDLYPKFEGELERWCAERGLKLLASFPYSPSFFEAARRGVPVLEVGDDALRRRFEELWERLEPMIPSKKPLGGPLPASAEVHLTTTEEGTL
ncbi:MAG: P-loop NTPase [bacterium]|nr:P-loop NTPase [bacterium]